MLCVLSDIVAQRYYGAVVPLTSANAKSCKDDGCQLIGRLIFGMLVLHMHMRLE